MQGSETPIRIGSPARVQVVDSHTGGEPTRVVVAGAPDLGRGPMSERLERFRTHFEPFRAAVVNEPRGSDVLVGALLLEPADPGSAAGLIFFNNSGVLGMCGHGTIGVVKTLEHLGRVGPGEVRLDTPVGVVTACLHANRIVSVRNVPAYRLAKGVSVDVAGHGGVTGDVAWGGNWFFLCSDHGQILSMDRLDALTEFCLRIRTALAVAGITGADGHEIDHVELFGPPSRPDADSRNFVLCPGGAYDRSPCGTGTSAKVACLYEDGNLAAGASWRQESIVGSVFEAFVERTAEGLVPTISGEAWITAEATLVLDESDPFCWGLNSRR
ncbi:MAG TPA: 4-hydroxyproline epimerase [Chthonomonadaceae bacterium]|nr:4-hydroxyproline epimerase [Chthonomonadaceae bacterium]